MPGMGTRALFLIAREQASKLIDRERLIDGSVVSPCVRDRQPEIRQRLEADDVMQEALL